MPYCLGLYVEDNYIKYAKVLNEKEQDPKVETHGVVFYDNLSMALEQIIKETYSYNCDISTNLNNEFYNYFDVFSGINQSSLKKHLKLVFAEQVCAEKNINPSSIESRYIVGNKKFDNDQREVVYVSANKSDILSKKQTFKNKMKKLLPISIANLSLLDIDDTTNTAILNIESYTTLTIVLQGQVKKVFNINIGMSNILSKLNQKYSSYSKSYERCKATTIYTEGSKDLLQDDSDDSEQITPLLYDLGQRIVALLREYQGIINKIYITGSCVAINNVDLYFEEMLNDISVEILKPNFVMKNLELSNKIKDFTEVNAAIALAISNGKINDYDMNFVAQNPIGEQFAAIKDNKVISNLSQKMPKIKPKEKEVKVKAPKLDKKLNFNFNIVVRENMAVTFLLIGYICITAFISNKYKTNTQLLATQTAKVNQTIATIDADKKEITTNIQKYNDLQAKINELSEQLNEINGVTYDVPSFLTRVALVIPDDVLVTKIYISSDKKITIDAQCTTYAPLGFFITNLKDEEIMKNITTQIVDSTQSSVEDEEAAGSISNEGQTGVSAGSIGAIQKIIISGEII